MAGLKFVASRPKMTNKLVIFGQKRRDISEKNLRFSRYMDFSRLHLKNPGKSGNSVLNFWMKFRTRYPRKSLGFSRTCIFQVTPWKSKLSLEIPVRKIRGPDIWEKSRIFPAPGISKLYLEIPGYVWISRHEISQEDTWEISQFLYFFPFYP